MKKTEKLYQEIINSIIDVYRYGLPDNKKTSNLMRKETTEGLKSNKDVKEFINQVNNYTINQNLVVVFIARDLFPNMQRLANSLKKNGIKTFLLSFSDIKPSHFKTFSKSFHNGILNITNFLFLREIMKQINGKIIFHVQCWMWDFLLGRFVIENKKDSKVVCEFYDISGILSEYKYLIKNWDKQAVKLDLESEKFIIENSDYVVHRYKPEVYLEYTKFKKYRNVSKFINFNQYPSIENFKSLKSKETKFTAKLVYLGSVVPRNKKYHSPKLFPLWGMLEAIEQLIKQNFHITIFFSFVSNPEYYVDYFNLSKKYKENFQIKESIPSEELSKKIASFDFGILLSNINLKKTHISDFHWRSAIGTKFFSYLEAGLPLIVNGEYLYQSEIIKKNNIGITVNSEQISDLKNILLNYNVNELKNNVKQFVGKNLLEEKVEKIIRIYKDL